MRIIGEQGYCGRLGNEKHKTQLAVLVPRFAPGIPGSSREEGTAMEERLCIVCSLTGGRQSLEPQDTSGGLHCLGRVPPVQAESRAFHTRQ